MASQISSRQGTESATREAVVNTENSSLNGLRSDLLPITNVHEAFTDMVFKRQSEIIAMANSGGIQLRVATICSGTEAPVFALKLIQEISGSLTGSRSFLQFEHLFSVEIEPFKQAYISRNAPGVIVFRNVIDLCGRDVTTAPTILGYRLQIPTDIDLLIAGTSCVDFSALNTSKKNSMQLKSQGKALKNEWSKWKAERRKASADEYEGASQEPRIGFFDDFRKWLADVALTEVQEASNEVLGESSETFLSTVCYMNRTRPKMAILENVMGAPWDSMCNLFLHAAGYAAKHVKTDTKNFYIPHTRQRGYTLAIDREAFGDAADKIVEQWQTQVRNLERGASAPVQDWLLSPHDPFTVRSRQEGSERAIVANMPRAKEKIWERSKIRHNRMRRLLELGNGRPLTAWGLGGAEQPYDRIDKLVIRGQNDRALDCIDIYYLRYRRDEKKSCDIRFKSMIIDISQNVDRRTIDSKFGITGCLTPRGSNFITDQGRLISGYEALILQGLPLMDLDLSRESQEELRDLAGNAMTTTVVGSTLLSLFISVHENSDSIHSLPIRSSTTESSTVILRQPLCQPAPEDYTIGETRCATVYPIASIQQVLDISRRCRRYCYCNGGAKYSTEDLVRCEICGTIRCVNCKGNPKHQFRHCPSIRDPVMNDMAAQELMKYFPATLVNVFDRRGCRLPFRENFGDPKLGNRILRCLQSVTFCYTQVILSEKVTICYSGTYESCIFRLEAVVSESCVIWYLFLDPWCQYGQLLKKAVGTTAYQILRPFGRTQIDAGATCLLPRCERWEFWMFKEINLDFNVMKLDPRHIELGCKNAKNIPSEVRNLIGSITGTYAHHPECDTAEDSLHVREKYHKRYLFKDPSKIGSIQADCYIISNECRLLDRHEFRDFCINFPSDWSPRSNITRITAMIEGYWTREARDSTINGRPISYASQVGLCYIPPASILQYNDDEHRIRTLASVRLESSEIAEKFKTLLKYEWTCPGSWAVVSRPDHSALFSLLAPVNVRLDGIEPRTSLTDTRHCVLCCPELPVVHWMDSVVGPRSDYARKPFRVPDEMHRYEEKLRGCGEPFQVLINIKASGAEKGGKEVTVNYEVNVDFLIHRAVNHLQRDDDPDDLPIKVFVDIKKGSLNIPNLRFQPFRKSLRRLEESECTEDSIGSDINPEEPFVDGYTLTKHQEISLRWMQERELDPSPFTEREIEEYRSDPLNLRLLGVAEREITRGGGILADDVGYGKTVVSLALMAAQRGYDENESLKKRAASKRKTLALAATLVIAPSHLVNQWHSETEKFLGWKDTDILVIKRFCDLQVKKAKVESEDSSAAPDPKRTRTSKKSGLSLEKLRVAKIIIVSTALFNEDYYRWLGKLAGSLPPPRKEAIPTTNSVRHTNNPNVLGAFQAWYEDATTYARKHVSGSDPAIFSQDQFDMITRRRNCLQKSKEDIMDKNHDELERIGLDTLHKYETEGPAQGRGKTLDTANEGRLTEKDFDRKVFAYVLEAFSYARVIYDEFSYENFCVAQFVKTAEAHAKWVLSATPPTSNVRAVCDIASMLRVHVARPVKLRPGLPLITEGPIVLRESRIDNHLSYARLHTDGSVCERVEKAHEFLKHFASANPFDEEGLGKIQVHEEVCCSYMSRRELIRYLDVQRSLRNFDLDTSAVDASLKQHKLDLGSTADIPKAGRIRAGLGLANAASVGWIDNETDDFSSLISHYQQNLEVVQKKLMDVTQVAIWLILRREEEDPKKKNESAKNIVEDLAWHIQCILDGNAEEFGGPDSLKAVTDATFDERQFAYLSKWLKTSNTDETKSQDFAKILFPQLHKQTAVVGEPEWAKYYQLPVSLIDQLKDPEVLTCMRELTGQGPGPLASLEARKRLRELFNNRQPQPNSQAQETNICPKRGRKRKRIAQCNSPDNQAEGTGREVASIKDMHLRPVYPRLGVKKMVRGGTYTETESEITNIMVKMTKAIDEVAAQAKQLATARNLLCEATKRKCSGCGQSSRDMRFHPDCAHFICARRHPDARFCGQIRSKKYPDGSGCVSLIKNRTIPVQQIDSCPMDTVATRGTPKVGSKSRAIVAKIQSILQRNEGKDKILVFYQLDQQRKEICDLLKYHKIAFDTQPGSGNASTTKRQQLVKHDNSKDRVRILHLNSVEAAGSNFQDANHVLFLSTPVFGKQEDIDKYVKQAKGRCVRHGQTKDVFVYYFVTLNTFEVDLLQLRKRADIRLNGSGSGNGNEKTGFGGLSARFVPWGPGEGGRKSRGGGNDDDAEEKEEEEEEEGEAQGEDISSWGQLTSGLSDDEVWKLTDETNWLVQQNREC